MKRHVLYCKNCGYGYIYGSKEERNEAIKSKRRCVNCNQTVSLENGGQIEEFTLMSINRKREDEWQKKVLKQLQNEEKAAKDKKAKSKIPAVTATILAGLAAISGFVISFLEETKAFLAQASSLILEIVDIVLNFFSSIG